MYYKKKAQRIERKKQKHIFFLYYKVLVQYYFMAGCSKLKLYTINPEATTNMTQQIVVVQKPRVFIKQNHKKYSVNSKDDRNRKIEQKPHRKKQETVGRYL